MQSNAKKIRNVLSGLSDGAAAQVVTDPTSGALIPMQVRMMQNRPGLPAPTTPQPTTGVSIGPGAAETANRMEQMRISEASKVAFYDKLRTFRPDESQIFEMEQKRAAQEAQDADDAEAQIFNAEYGLPGRAPDSPLVTPDAAPEAPKISPLVPLAVLAWLLFGV